MNQIIKIGGKAMYYKVKLTNTETSESRVIKIYFASKKKAAAWAAGYEKSLPYMKVEILKD